MIDSAPQTYLAQQLTFSGSECDSVHYDDGNRLLLVVSGRSVLRYSVNDPSAAVPAPAPASAARTGTRSVRRRRAGPSATARSPGTRERAGMPRLRRRPCRPRRLRAEATEGIVSRLPGRAAGHRRGSVTSRGVSGSGRCPSGSGRKRRLRPERRSTTPSAAGWTLPRRLRCRCRRRRLLSSSSVASHLRGRRHLLRRCGRSSLRARLEAGATRVTSRAGGRWAKGEARDTTE